MRTFYFKARNIGQEKYLTYTMGEETELDEDVDVEFSSALISIAGATVSSNSIHAVSAIAPQNFKIFLAVSIYDTSSSS